MATFVFDLDDTLICEGDKGDHDEVIEFYSTAFDCMARKYIKIRPWYDEILKYCFDNYQVGVYSMGHSEYVNAIVPILFQKAPRFVFNYTHCVRENHRMYKKLSLCPTNFDQTYIIDDNLEVVWEKERCIVIKPYEGDKNDVELLKILQKIKQNRW